MKNRSETGRRRAYEAVGVLLTLVTLAVIYVAHREVPYMMDDNWYSTKLFSDEPIQNIKDVFDAQCWHYRKWGGRTVAHFLLQLVLMLNEQAADVLNVAVTIALGIVICKVAKVKGFFFFAMIEGLLYAFNANWKMSMHWQSGAANYLYITVLILLFLQCYLREVEVGTDKIKGITFWIFPLGVLAGWSNENMGPAVWILTLIVMFLVKKRQDTIPAWMYLGSLGCLVGSIMVIVAPGNFVRSKEAALEGYGVLWKIFLRCYAESKALLEYLFLPIIAVSFALLLCKAIGCVIGMKTKLLLLGALLSWGAMILSPHYPDRATFGTMILLMCAFIRMINEIGEAKQELKLPLSLGLLLLWFRGMYFAGEFISFAWGWIK